ncbi:MAG: leucine dehydrogenase [Bacteroidia bacterium]|nr:leucine dehydrogenase [Bacteroidia bacterium]MDW8301038.1 Glu/Leu/Phe/Val dehydrogenase dimerization domain-containing protein [Bacteroidia bacterium]
MESTTLFGGIVQYEHEQVMLCYDKHTGLKAIIAIHNTILGPALGGTRMWPYANELEALEDVLRLSRGMTYKAALAGLNLGGGKAVIIGDSRKDKSEAYMRRYGKFVHNLGGKYITAEDVGTTTKDMEYIRMETPYVTGIPESMGGSGDPSPFTAYGVYMGIKAAAKYKWGKDSLQHKKVSVQGVGHVGIHIIDHLIKEGATVYFTDIYEDKIKNVQQQYPQAIYVKPEEIYSLDVDIYAPCALGATLNDETIPQLKCEIVAGCANNQLKDEVKHAQMLKERDILYAPDYLVNAGGLINVYSELNGYNRKRVLEQCEYIYTIALNVFEEARSKNVTTAQAANQLAEKRIQSIAHCKLYR